MAPPEASGFQDLTESAPRAAGHRAAAGLAAAGSVAARFGSAHQHIHRDNGRQAITRAGDRASVKSRGPPHRAHQGPPRKRPTNRYQGERAAIVNGCGALGRAVAIHDCFASAQPWSDGGSPPTLAMDLGAQGRRPMSTDPRTLVRRIRCPTSRGGDEAGSAPHEFGTKATGRCGHRSGDTGLGYPFGGEAQ